VYHREGDEEARKHDVTRFPTILIEPERYRIRYTGAPAGEEGKSLIETVLHVSARDSGLAKESREMLAGLSEPRHIRVFVNPTCPYCPMQVSQAFKAAIECPLIEAECVEINENPELADRFNVSSVPHTVVNDTLASLGLLSETRFIAEVVTLKSAEKLAGQASEVVAEEYDVVIIGAGPAGLTAGIYTARSGLKTVILERRTVGGQVAITPVVENYPGFANIAGVRLMDLISLQARQYAPVHEMEEVVEIKVGKQVEVLTERGDYLAKAVILTTGATWRKLGVPGESELFGHGVSYCATCDGYFYKDKKVVVVGGGNTALTDGLYLKNIGAQVTLVHRRSSLSGEHHLQASVGRESIPVRLNSQIVAILGKDRVTGVRVQDMETGKTEEIAADGVFVAIGEIANTGLAEDLGVTLASDGSIAVNSGFRTNIPRVYAAGDVTGGIRQIVTAIGQGAIAASAVFEDIAKRAAPEPKEIME
jgi:thioredoxin reductase (NADPH)